MSKGKLSATTLNMSCYLTLEELNQDKAIFYETIAKYLIRQNSGRVNSGDVTCQEYYNILDMLYEQALEDRDET